MESLDDVIDALIADRVIHRHRRKWLIALALVVVLVLVVLVTGGWKEKKGRTIPTLTAPVTVTAGRFEYDFTKAEIIRTATTEEDDDEAKLRVYFAARNVDTETHKSKNVDGGLLRLLPADGGKPIQSNGDECRGLLGWELVYGLPPESCFTEFDVEPDFSADLIEVAVYGERYESDNAFLGVDDAPYWHNGTADAVVQLKPAVVIDDGNSE